MSELVDTLPPTFQVRAMKSQESDFKIFFDNSVVAVGWSYVDFTKYTDDVEGLLSEVTVEYEYGDPRYHPSSVGRWMNQIRRFMAFKPGARIVVPYYDGVCLAVVDGKRLYSKAAKVNDLSNQITVNYEIDPSTGQPRVIPRDALSEALQRRLRVRGSTLSDLWEFKEEVDRMFNETDYSWTSAKAKEEERVKEQFRHTLLSRIQDGSTNLKTGGIGLERLVKELFEHEGYEAKVLDKRHFKNGDADVEAVRSDLFGRTKILAQIKHHSGVTDDWGLKQLLEIKRTETEDNVILVLITTAIIPETVKARADDNDIQAMDGKALTEWVMSHLHNIQPDTRARLGISKVPRFVSEIEAGTV